MKVMTKPWELKTDDSRKEDSRTVFIIFCEDEASETTYLEYFETDRIKINCIGNQKSKQFNIFNAIDYCIGSEYFETVNEKLTLMSDSPNIWCVFDFDKKGEKNEYHYFNTSIEIAENRGFKVAWSNDAFELWILLHFEEIDIQNEDFKNRKAYYDRLTEIFKSIPNPNHMLSVALSHDTFKYKEGLKSKKKFSGIVLPEIKSRINEAITRAKVLESYFVSQNLMPNQKAPCTMVHHLVEELIREGGKEI